MNVEQVQWNIVDSIKNPIDPAYINVEQDNPLKCHFKTPKPGYYNVQLQCLVDGNLLSTEVSCEFNAMPITTSTLIEIAEGETAQIVLEPLTMTSLLRVTGQPTDNFSINLSQADLNFDGQTVLIFDMSGSAISVKGEFLQLDATEFVTKPNTGYRFLSVGKESNQWFIEQLTYDLQSSVSSIEDITAEVMPE